MKLTNSSRIGIQLFFTSVLIIFTLIGFAFFITHTLHQHNQKNHEEMRLLREELRKKMPLEERAVIFNDLLTHKKDITGIFNNLHSKRSPFKKGAITKNDEIIYSTPDFNFKNTEKLQLNDGHIYHYRFVPHSAKGRRLPPPPGTIRLIFLGLGVAILLGLILTSIIVTLYFNKKSREAEKIMGRIMSGDLKARFPLNFQDQNFGLMSKFNEMADQIEELVLSLKEKRDEQTKVLQELAHDLRTPIASMKSLNELLLEKKKLLTPEKEQELQTLIRKEIDYFSRLVEELLFLSGVNDPKYTNHFQKLDLTKLIADEIAVFSPSKIKIHFHPQALIVNGDQQLLIRLIKNALSNALKHARSSVDIRIEGEDVLIEDDGPGLNEEDLFIFGKKKFSRAINEEISIGLGSVIMNKILQIHGGSLAIENKNPGARLKISFKNF